MSGRRGRREFFRARARKETRRLMQRKHTIEEATVNGPAIFPPSLSRAARSPERTIKVQGRSERRTRGDLRRLEIEREREREREGEGKRGGAAIELASGSDSSDCLNPSGPEWREGGRKARTSSLEKPGGFFSSSSSSALYIIPWEDYPVVRAAAEKELGSFGRNSLSRKWDSSWSSKPPCLSLSLSLCVCVGHVTVGRMKFSLTGAGAGAGRGWRGGRENSASRISRCSTRSMRRYNSGKSPVAGSQKTPGIRLFSFRDTLASPLFPLAFRKKRAPRCGAAQPFVRARARAHERFA